MAFPDNMMEFGPDDLRDLEVRRRAKAVFDRMSGQNRQEGPEEAPRPVQMAPVPDPAPREVQKPAGHTMTIEDGRGSRQFTYVPDQSSPTGMRVDPSQTVVRANPNLLAERELARQLGVPSNTDLAEMAQRFYGKMLPEQGGLPYQTVTPGERATLAQILMNQQTQNDNRAFAGAQADLDRDTRMRLAELASGGRGSGSAAAAAEATAREQAKMAEIHYQNELGRIAAQMGRPDAPTDADKELARRRANERAGVGLGTATDFNSRRPMPAGGAVGAAAGAMQQAQPSASGNLTDTTKDQLWRSAVADIIKQKEAMRMLPETASDADRYNVESAIARSITSRLGGRDVDENVLKSMVNDLIQSDVPVDLIRRGLETGIAESGMQQASVAGDARDAGYMGDNRYTPAPGFEISKGFPIFESPSIRTPMGERRFKGDFDTMLRKNLSSLRSADPGKLASAKANALLLSRIYALLGDQPNRAFGGLESVPPPTSGFSESPF